MTYDYILFDLDGTLTDSHVGVSNGIAYALNTLGVPAPVGDEVRRWLGPPLSTSFREFAGLGEQDALEAIRLYRDYYNHTGAFENRVYEGIPELLRQLHACGKKLAVATSKVDYAAVAILKHFELEKYFSTIVGADEYGLLRGTKSLVMAQAMRDLNIHVSASAVMVGDRHHDIHGATEHGLDSVGVTWGYADEHELTNAGATFLCNSVSELTALLI